MQLLYYQVFKSFRFLVLISPNFLLVGGRSITDTDIVLFIHTQIFQPHNTSGYLTILHF